MMKLQLNDLDNDCKPFVAYKNPDFIPHMNDIVVCREDNEEKTEHHFIVKGLFYDYEQECVFAMVKESNETKKTEKTEVTENVPKVESDEEKKDDEVVASDAINDPEN